MAKKPTKSSGRVSLHTRMQELIKSGDVETMQLSRYTQDNLLASTPYYAINIALSGDINGGLYSGIRMVAGKSKTWKSTFGCIMAAAYQRKYPDAYVFFYDSEKGTSKKYMESFGVDLDRVIYKRIDTIEDLMVKMFADLSMMNEGDDNNPPDRAFFFVDSIGQLESAKAITDLTEKSADVLPVDMGIRARRITSFARSVVPMLTRLDMPAYIINHYYETMGQKYPQKQLKGGQQLYLSSEDVWIISSTKEKTKDGLIEGFTFNIYIDKGRKMKEGIKIEIPSFFDETLSPYSGMFDIALGMEWVTMPSSGWYSRKLVDKDTGELYVEQNKVRKGDVEHDAEWWKPIIENELFQQDVRDTFQLHGSKRNSAFTVSTEDEEFMALKMNEFNPDMIQETSE